MSPLERRSRHRLAWAGVLSAALVVAALTLPSAGGDDQERATSLRAAVEAEKAALGLPHVDLPGTAAHDHSDPATKNLVSRAGEVGDETRDPTTAVQARASEAYVAAQRTLPDPVLTKTRVTDERTTTPRNRFAMANGCYALRTTRGTYLTRSGDGVRLRKASRAKADPFTFRATDLGEYLLYGRPASFLATSGGLAFDRQPSPDAEWVVRTAGAKGERRFTFRVKGGGPSLKAAGKRLDLGKRATRFALERTQGCARYPEAGVNIKGRPHAGISPFQEVRGYVDAHTHGMAFEFLGGQVHCGRPWHKYGVASALVDCPDHTVTGGRGAVLEAALSGIPSHDPVGWPTLKDWPAPDSLTHEGTYYKWMERAWRGGERLFVNLLVENNQLCMLYPLKRNSCDDMDSIRLQAKRMFEFQDYIDAQFGGPGKGFYRIVRDPFEARQVINDGKLAVVMGIETSVPFGCTFKAVLGNDIPACDAGDITRQINEMHRLGVRQMELVNKFDNALGGVAGDTGTTGVAVNAANFLETGTFWDMRHCEPADGESADRTQLGFPDVSAGQQDALFGAIAQIFGDVLPALPLYPTPLHCNTRGLTSLGEHTIRELVKRDMIFDPDHLSVKARKSSLDVIEELDYKGVISSHSWSTPDAYPRVYENGGFITPYAGDSTGFVEKWRQHVRWADERYYYGIGFGADINGLGAQGNPRGAGVANKVTYPIRGINGIRIDRQQAGQRVYDINVDGVAQYGLYPDWIEDLSQVAGREGDDILEDMSRGPEAYLQMWERAQGIDADSCRNADLRQPLAAVKRKVRAGMSTTAVMRAVGQPFTRLGTTYGFCAKSPGNPQEFVTVRFNQQGRVQGLST